MTDYPTIIFPNDFALDVGVEESMPNNDVQTRSGRRFPVPLRAQPFKRIEVKYGPKNQVALNEIRNLFHIMDGTAHTFRVVDPQDNSSQGDPNTTITAQDQNIGAGDATETEFQIRKARTSGATTVYSTIRNIVPGSVLLAIDGVPTGAGWSVNNTTGIITFSAAPGIGEIITVGFRYYLKVRFADPDLMQKFLTNARAEFDSFYLEVDET